MWTRTELKERAKEALKRNYWKAVLVSLLIIFIGGGTNSVSTEWRTDASSNVIDEETSAGGTAHNVIVLENEADFPISSEREETIRETEERINAAVRDALETTMTQIQQVNPAVWIAFGVVFIIVFLLVIAIILVIDIFLFNPLYVGTQRFMLKSVDGTGSISELGYAFDHHYMNNVKTTFLRDLHIFLWALLFIIPGIYKKYQYYMVDYILAEHPDMPPKAVLECSKQMMDGHKWNTFVLNLSFILWHMLGTFTCGIVEVFYVRPYQELTRAALYRTLTSREYSSRTGEENGL